MREARFSPAPAQLPRRLPSSRLGGRGLRTVSRQRLAGPWADGLRGSLPPAPPQFSRERLLTVKAIKVVSPRHPLAAHRALIPMSVLCEHIQLVHADHANVWRAGRFGLLSPRIWRLCDLAAKHHFLRAGFGFGIMPLHMVEADLASGALVEIRVEDEPSEGHLIAMSAVYLANSPLGPAGRWFIDRLKEEAAPPVQRGGSVGRTQSA